MYYYPSIERDRFDPIVVKILILSNVIMFILELIFPKISYTLALLPEDVLAGRNLWTLFTHMFIHYGILHLFLNMYALFIFGPECERELGHEKFALLYFISGLVGGVLHAFISPMKWVRAGGASGAVFGVMAAFAILFPRRKIAIFVFVGFIVLPAWLLVVGYALIELLYLLLEVQDFIGHAAHLGGMLGGATITILHKESKKKKMRPPFERQVIFVYQEYMEDYDYDYDYY